MGVQACSIMSTRAFLGAGLADSGAQPGFAAAGNPNQFSRTHRRHCRSGAVPEPLPLFRSVPMHVLTVDTEQNLANLLAPRPQ